MIVEECYFFLKRTIMSKKWHMPIPTKMDIISFGFPPSFVLNNTIISHFEMKIKGGISLKREWLVELRQKKELSQEELAKICDTTQMTISNIENGARRPSPDLAQKLAKALKFNWTKFYENQEIKEE